MDTNSIGAQGERFAARFLKRLGYRIRETHVTAHWAELDIVAEENGTLVFVEVRTRSGSGPVRPEDTVVGAKRRHLERSIQLYLGQNHWEQRPWRLDVIAVEFSTDPPTVRHYKGV
jgi:putative endonuclease